MTEAHDTEPPSRRLGVVILAAGQGTRMRSPRPKVLHSVGGLPMVGHVANIARRLCPDQLVVVVPVDGDLIARAAGPGCRIAIQAEQLGTAHALSMARPQLDGAVDQVLMLYGDATLVLPNTLEAMRAALSDAPLVFLTAILDDPTGYGRVIRDVHGRVASILEERDIEQGAPVVHEVNSGIMAFDAAWLWPRLERVRRQEHGEYYLPDLVQMAIDEGAPVAAVQPSRSEEVEGINTQTQLARSNAVIWQRERERLMDEGVTLLAPDSIYVDPGVKVGTGSVLHPNTFLHGRTHIGADCQVGPNSILRDAEVGDRCTILASVLTEVRVMSDVQIGPFSHLRPETIIHEGVELGTFAEVKASEIGAGTRIHHFSYIGDATIGQKVNIGAGTVTCNFDGQDKHRTIVEDDAFIGSDTMLVAPVRVGKGARTGAGSVVRRDVAAGKLAVGVPARIVSGRDAPRSSSTKDQPDEKASG